MNKYEALYILDAELDDEAKAAEVSKFKGIIETSGEVTSIDEWGVRKLAYPINKKNEGYYVLMNFKSKPDVVDELTRVFGITENVMRYLIINEDE